MPCASASAVPWLVMNVGLASATQFPAVGSMAMKHFSPSQYGMYLRCPEQWRRRHEEGEIIPPGVSLARGSGTHKAVEHRNRRKADRDIETPRAEMIDLAVSHFDAIVSGEVYLPDASRSKAVQLGEGRDETAAATGVWSDEVAPVIQSPVWIEKRISIPTSLGVDLLGIVDLVHADEMGRHVIEDLKTSGKSASQVDTDARVSNQLTWYAMAYREETGEFPAGGTGLRTLMLRGGRATVRWSPTARTQADVDALCRGIVEVLRAIRAGVFPPCDPSSWVCAPKWCGYYATCKYVARGGSK